MSIFRQISSTFVPSSDCLIASAICSSVNRLFFMAWLLFYKISHAEISTLSWSGFLGEGQAK